MDEKIRPMLEVNSLVAGYGKKQVLNGLDVVVSYGEIVALIGHNGAGKSTFLKVVFGLLPAWEGRVVFDKKPLNLMKTHDLLRAGMAYIPQGNRVFTDLSVRENLEIAGVTLSSRERLKDGINRALELFPTLRARLHQRAGTLSGGEKQMLALANSFVLSPRMILLDEPSLGLSPWMVKEAFSQIEQLNCKNGVTVLIVEQKSP